MFHGERCRVNGTRYTVQGAGYLNSEFFNKKSCLAMRGGFFFVVQVISTNIIPESTQMGVTKIIATEF